MATSYSSYHVFSLFLLLLLFPAYAFMDIRRHFSRPWIYEFNPDREDFQPTLNKPLLVINQQHLTTTLANTTGFTIASAILQTKRRRLPSLILVDEILVNGTELVISNCDSMEFYISSWDNESEILENNPEIVDDILSGKREVLKLLDMNILRFDGGRNVSVSHRFIYSDAKGAVAVHGFKNGLEAMVTEIKKLRVYPPLGPGYNEFVIGEKPSTVVHGYNRFMSLEYSPTEEEEVFINDSEMKIEMVIVANIVPNQREYDGVLDKAFQAQLKQDRMPYKMTMMYSLYF